MNDGALTNGRYIIPALWTAELGEYVFDLRLALGALIALMMADFWWGVREAKQDGKHFSDSKAIRRTANKFGDYFTYMLIGYFLASAIGVRLGWCGNGQVGVLFGIGIGAFCEIDSLVKHIAYVQFHVRFSWKKFWKYGLRFIISLVKKKNEDIGEALEETFEEQIRNESVEVTSVDDSTKMAE
jgi:hypothetical protein